MVMHTVTWDEIKKDSLEKVLRSVVAAREILTIRLPEGEEVTIQPKPPLEPLPVLEGFIRTDGRTPFTMSQEGAKARRAPPERSEDPSAS